MAGTTLVDVIHHGGQRGGFARTGRPRHKKQASGFQGVFMEEWGQVQRVDGGDLRFDDARGDGIAFALQIDVHTEAADMGDDIGKIVLTHRGDFVELFSLAIWARKSPCPQASAPCRPWPAGCR